MTEPIYETPKALLVKKEPDVDTLKRLSKEQSLLGAVLGTLFALVPALLFLTLVTWFNVFASLLLSLFPGVAVGLTVKYCARPYQFSYRLFPALVTTVAMLAFFAWSGAKLLVFLLALVNGAIVLQLARRSLNQQEEQALSAYKLGQISL